MQTELKKVVLSKELLGKENFQPIEDPDYVVNVEKLLELRRSVLSDEENTSFDEKWYSKEIFKSFIKRVYEHHLFLAVKEKEIKVQPLSLEVTLLEFVEFVLKGYTLKVNPELWEKRIPPSERMLFTLGQEPIKKILSLCKLDTSDLTPFNLTENEKAQIIKVVNYIKEEKKSK